MQPTPMPDHKNAFAFRDYRFFFVTKLLNSLATIMVAVGIGWQVYSLARKTGSIEQASLKLGLVGLVEFIAIAVFSLIAGYVSDRIDRRWIMRGALFFLVITVSMLWRYTLSEYVQLWPVFAIAALIGVGRAFMAPSASSLAPNLVERSALPSAIAWNSVSWQIAAVCGPAMCGQLIEFGLSIVYAIAVVLFACALITAQCIRPVAMLAPTKETPIASIKAGLHYIRSSPVVLGAISLDLFAVILGGATAMLPAYARDILHVGSAGFGQLRAAPALGAALVAVILAFKPLRHKVGLWMFGCVAVYGLSTIIFGVSRSFPLSIVALAVLGAADMISVFIRQSLVQIHTPDAMRGRVASVSTVFISASNELGEFQSGISARFLGAVPSVVAGGVGALLVTIMWALWFADLRKADSLSGSAATT